MLNAVGDPCLAGLLRMLPLDGAAWKINVRCPYRGLGSRSGICGRLGSMRARGGRYIAAAVVAVIVLIGLLVDRRIAIENLRTTGVGRRLGGDQRERSL